MSKVTHIVHVNKLHLCDLSFEHPQKDLSSTIMECLLTLPNNLSSYLVNFNNQVPF